MIIYILGSLVQTECHRLGTDRRSKWPGASAARNIPLQPSGVCQGSSWARGESPRNSFQIGQLITPKHTPHSTSARLVRLVGGVYELEKCHYISVQWTSSCPLGDNTLCYPKPRQMCYIGMDEKRIGTPGGVHLLCSSSPTLRRERGRETLEQSRRRPAWR